MKCKGCGKNIMHYHELIINIKSDNYGNEDKRDFWHGDCYVKMVLKEYGDLNDGDKK